MRNVRIGIILTVWVLAAVLPPALPARAEQSENERRLVTLVEQAAGLVNTEGSAAFPRFHTKGTMWRQGNTYIFIGDAEGVMLVHGGDRTLEGKNLFELKDVNGKLFVQEFIETVTTRGSGWVDYMWPRPGEATPVKKKSYLKEARLGDKTLFVGAGFYAH